MIIFSAAAAIGAAITFLVWRRYSIKSRAERIKRFVFPVSVAKKIQDVYPHLTDVQTAKVIDGLREYFHVSLIANRRMVSMPSKVVDVAWHEFILFTKVYQRFCGQALGRFLHHIPSEAMRTPTQAQEGIKRAWRLSCKKEGINPTSPTRLPLLFAMDAMLNIPDGYRYSLNCQSNSDYCASHIGCGGGCGSSSASNGCGGSDAGDGGCGGD